MNRRIAAFILTIMVSSSVVIVGVVFANVWDKYSFQLPVIQRDSQSTLFIHELVDTNLTITFSNESNLFYKTDIAYYEPISILSASSCYEVHSSPTEVSAQIHPFQRVRSLNITVGPVVHELFIIRCWNLETTIVYDSEVGLNQSLYYLAGGSLKVIVEENIQHSVAGRISADVVNLDVTIPTGFSGAVFFSSYSVTTEITGWAYSLDFYYDTHAFGTHDGFYNNSTESNGGDELIGDFVFKIDCDELHLTLVS
ncbi:MAG: hypothetical protein ACFFFK_02025 [Candidatus Thorarchaeota archaeon]